MQFTGDLSGISTLPFLLQPSDAGLHGCPAQDAHSCSFSLPPPSLSRTTSSSQSDAEPGQQEMISVQTPIRAVSLKGGRVEERITSVQKILEQEEGRNFQYPTFDLPSLQSSSSDFIEDTAQEMATNGEHALDWRKGRAGRTFKEEADSPDTNAPRHTGRLASLILLKSQILRKGENHKIHQTDSLKQRHFARNYFQNLETVSCDDLMSNLEFAGKHTNVFVRNFPDSSFWTRVKTHAHEPTLPNPHTNALAHVQIECPFIRAGSDVAKIGEDNFRDSINYSFTAQSCLQRKLRAEVQNEMTNEHKQLVADSMRLQKRLHKVLLENEELCKPKDGNLFVKVEPLGKFQTNPAECGTEIHVASEAALHEAAAARKSLSSISCQLNVFLQVHFCGPFLSIYQIACDQLALVLLGLCNITQCRNEIYTRIKYMFVKQKRRHVVSE
jgi:hypothetical protein